MKKNHVVKEPNWYLQNKAAVALQWLPGYRNHGNGTLDWGEHHSDQFASEKHSCGLSNAVSLLYLSEEG